MITVLVVVSGVAAAVGTNSGVFVLRRVRTSPALLPMALMMLGCSEWALARACSYAAEDPELKLKLEFALYPGAALVTASAFWYFLAVAGHRRVLGRRTFALLCIEPVAVTVATVTNGWHGQFYAHAELVGPRMLAVTPGPLYWVNIAYSYILLTVGTALLARTTAQAVVAHRSLHFVVLLGGLAPFLGNAVSQVWHPYGVTVDVAPALFLVSAGLWFGMDQYRGKQRLEPVSTRQVLSAIHDTIVVLDPTGRVIDMNEAATSVVRGLWAESGGQGVSSFIGARWEDALPPEILAAYKGDSGIETLRAPSGAAYEVRVSRMTNTEGRSLGFVIMVRDVTEVEKLREDLADQAVHDGLTGLYNRRHLGNLLAEAVEDARATGRPLSAVMIDIDHFKAVNDHHGHAAGDAMLVKIAAVLSGGVREGDVVARYGGEEFAIVLPGTPAGAARQRAEQWRTECAKVRIRGQAGEVSVTVSAGVAEIAPGGDSELMLRLADNALYAAKAAGRDCVVVNEDVIEDVDEETSVSAVATSGRPSSEALGGA